MEQRKPSPAGQYLTFFLSGEEYAIAVLDVREIISYSSVTRVPGTAAYIRGVINLRGSVVPVFDLATKFGEVPGPVSKLSCIIVVEARLADGTQTVAGIIADSVHQVIELGDGAIEPPPAFGTHCHVNYLLGMARIDPKFVLVLDLSRLISGDEAAAGAVATTQLEATA